MAKINYIDHSGNKIEIEVDNGLTVMEGAIQNNVTGIDADALNIIYNLADFINKIAFGLVIWAAAMQNTRLASR